MAAIIHPSSRPTSALPQQERRPDRPDLRLIQGGRRAVTPGDLVRRRLVAALVATLLAVAIAATAVAVGRGALGALAPESPATASAPATAASAGRTVVVRPGDTLWSIARRLQPSGDVRALVDRLEANHGGGALQPGERLVVD